MTGFPVLCGVCPNSRPLCRWCHPNISSSVTLFSSCFQSFPASGSFPVSWLFASDGQNIEALASAPVLTINIQGWFPLGLTGVWSPCCPKDSQESFSAPQFESISFSMLNSVQLLICVWLWNPIDCSMPGLPVHHQHPELAQTHVHWVSDAIQLSHPLSPPSPPALNLSQHHCLFQWVGSLHQMAKVLEL